MIEKIYIKMFDKNNPKWCDNRGRNVWTVKNAEDYINDRLRILGWVSLNDVYDLLGFQRELEAQVIGWKISDVSDYEHYVMFETFPNGESDIEIIFRNMVKLL